MLGRVCVAAIAVLIFSDAQAACVKLDIQQVRLAGTVTPVLFYGPPNYGEDPVHDAKEVAAVLKLDQPISICPDLSANSAPPDSPVQETQMIFRDPPYGRQWNGKRVIASGTLFAAQTGHHHTPVMFDVRDVQPWAKAP